MVQVREITMAEIAEQQDNIRMIPLNKLVLSDLNMRKEGTDPKSDKALKASLRSQGVLQNFIVHPTDDVYAYGVAAGGRRLRLLNELVDEGELEEDHSVPCKVVFEDEALAMSIAENRNREDAHPADEFMAFKQLIDNGATQKDVATRYGVSNKYVSQRMRLAEVHPEILEAYRKDKIMLEAMMAYTIEPDQEKQLECFKNVRAQVGHLIRQYLVQSELHSNDPVVKFVGLNTYKRAGGRTSTDLFADTVMVLDADIVERLAMEKLEAIAEPVREEGWRWVSVSIDRPGHFWQFQHEDAEYSGDLQQEYEALVKAEEEADDAAWDYDGDDDDKVAELGDAQRDAENARIKFEDEHRDQLQYTDEQKSRSGTFIFIGRDGEPEIERGMYKPGKSSETSQTDSAGEKRDKPKHSQKLVQDLAHHRTQAFKVALTDHPDLVLQLLHFSLCDAIFNESGFSFYGSFIRISPDPEYRWANAPKVDYGDEPAAVKLAGLQQTLPMEWTKSESINERFEAFRALPPKVQRNLTMHAVLNRVSARVREEDELADHIIDEIQVPFLDHFIPTKDNLFGRIGKPELLEIIEQELGQARADELKKNKKGELAQLVHDLYNSEEVRQREGKDFYPTWIPEEL